MIDDADRYFGEDDLPPTEEGPPPVKFTNTEHDDFEIRTLDTQSFEVFGDDVTHPRPAPRPREAVPAPSAQAPLPKLDLRGTRPAADRAPQRAARPRRTAPPPRTTPAWIVTLRTMLVMALAAVLVSTIFSLWTNPSFFSDEFRAGLNQVQATQRVVNIQPSPLPTDTREVRIGIVAGHSGQPLDTSFASDPGAVCPDGLTELEINTAVAQRVTAKLNGMGYTVDLMDEFDPALENYLAEVLVSIHTNDCQDYGDAGTGYSVASASSRQTTRGADEFLRECLISQYGLTTALPQHGEVTFDMSSYHTFGEVSPDTPTAIIELGFMFRDRAILTGSPDVIAQGITNGIQCFLQPENFSTF